MPFARVVAYIVKGQHGRESENKQECSIQLWKLAAFSGQHQFQIQQSSQSQVEYIHHVQVHSEQRRQTTSAQITS